MAERGRDMALYKVGGREGLMERGCKGWEGGNRPIYGGREGKKALWVGEEAEPNIGLGGRERPYYGVGEEKGPNMEAPQQTWPMVEGNRPIGDKGWKTGLWGRGVCVCCGGGGSQPYRGRLGGWWVTVLLSKPTNCIPGGQGAMS